LLSFLSIDSSVMYLLRTAESVVFLFENPQLISTYGFIAFHQIKNFNIGYTFDHHRLFKQKDYCIM